MLFLCFVKYMDKYKNKWWQINRSYLQALILVCFPAGAGFALVSLLCCAVFVAGLVPSCTPGYLRGGPTWLDACFTDCLWAFVWPGCSVDFVAWPAGGTIGWPLTEGPWVWPPWTCRKRIISPKMTFCFNKLVTALDKEKRNLWLLCSHLSLVKVSVQTSSSLVSSHLLLSVRSLGRRVPHIRPRPRHVLPVCTVAVCADRVWSWWRNVTWWADKKKTAIKSHRKVPSTITRVRIKDT